ncbi:MAG TPA: AbrB family transcriptional regulator [Thermoanaerobaculia bacterium]|nr:AbrB family transcriptional regulator [Thermoanaerobaculia bacterium]
MSLATGDTLVAVIEGQRLVLEKREAILERLRHRFSKVECGVSLADELIAERRAESARDSE